MGSGTADATKRLAGNGAWVDETAAGSFDIHDDVTTHATIVDADLIAFADEGTAGDPMRITTAANLADYMQTEIRISTSVINSGTLPLARGGTNASSASGARTSLGLGSAATHDVGTDSGDVVELNTNGRFERQTRWESS